MNHAFICSPLRTLVGKYGGALSAVRPDDLSASVLRALVERTNIDPADIDDVILGCANQAGEDNRNVARMAVLLAGLPYSVPGVTVNRLCASSLEAVVQAGRALRSGEAQMMIAGGVESMSRAPYVLPKNVSGSALFGNLTAYDTALGWRFPNATMQSLFPLESMGETAENIAEQYQISREEQDEYAVASHQRYMRGAEQGVFTESIIPITIPHKKQTIIVKADESPRHDTSRETLAPLKPAFRKGGSVTAGNASSLNDGASAMIIATESMIKKYDLQPLARIVSGASAGVDPRVMGLGPTVAIPKALSLAGLRINQIERFEINEAFAVQVLACMRILDIEHERVNVFGGAIAIGHPLGMSGARIIGHLAQMLHRENIQYGVASACIGVGQGMAIVLERV
jgi:acetyl-CoA acyltransferase